jgi:AraC-like DNA-binding protein
MLEPSPAEKSLLQPMAISHFRLFWRHFGTTSTLKAAILDGTKLTEAAVQGTATQVALWQQIRQIENMNRLFGPGWIFDAPGTMHFSACGLIGVAAMSAPTLSDALSVPCDFLHLYTPIYRERLYRRPTISALEMALQVDVPLAIRQVFLFISTVATRSLIEVTLSRPLSDMRFSFTDPRPEYAARLEAVLGTTVEFGAPRNRILFPTAWLDLQSPLANPLLHATTLANLREMTAASANEPGTFSGRIEQMLLAAPIGRLTVEACAQSLGVSPRTMARRLGEEGRSFRILLDAAMRYRASAMIDKGTIPIPRIAEQLGYQDTASLYRAMRRWTADRAEAVH